MPEDQPDSDINKLRDELETQTSKTHALSEQLTAATLENQQLALKVQDLNKQLERAGQAAERATTIAESTNAAMVKLRQNLSDQTARQHELGRRALWAETVTSSVRAAAIVGNAFVAADAALAEFDKRFPQPAQ